MGYKEFLNSFSVTPFGAWIAKTFAAKVDPFFYKISGGKFTSTGPLTIPQLTLITVGRKSGKERTVQLGYHPDGDDALVVASNFGGKNHPAWSYNLDANPDCKIRLGAEVKRVTAVRLTDSEKAILWPKIEHTIPQMETYKTRTTRNIKVYRLRAS
jgi:deazaflavin-dependent oxidoreductase (nitroreductase family)